MKFCVLLLYLFEASQERDAVSSIQFANLFPFHVADSSLKIVAPPNPIFSRPPFPPPLYPPFVIFPPTGPSTGWGVFPTPIPGTPDSGCCSCVRIPYLNCIQRILLNDSTIFSTTVSNFEKANRLVPCLSLIDPSLIE